MVPQISKTECDLMQQNRSRATTHITATMTERPTKTVAALNAGDKMLAKSSRRPTHCADAVSVSVVPEDARMVQKRQRPKCPGLLELTVSPTHSSWRKTTMLRMAEHTVKMPHKMDTDLECLMYFVVSSWMVVEGEPPTAAATAAAWASPPGWLE